MAIDMPGEWWVGSEPGDIEEYLRAFSNDCYQVTLYRPVCCKCGSKCFRLIVAFEIVERECCECGQQHFICSEPEDWEEAIDEETPERCMCECGSDELNVGAGFAELPQFDFTKWIYIGYRCSRCGILGCVADRECKGPCAEVLGQV